MNDYKSKDGDNDSLMNEVTESIESAYSSSNLAENSAAKKKFPKRRFRSTFATCSIRRLPAKVAQQLSKLAEIELFNHQSATDYLQRNAGLMGLAYLEPNTYMDKKVPRPTSTRRLQTTACSREGLGQGGYQAASAQRETVSACNGCQYFNKDARNSKTCNLYHLPLVANAQELTQIVNHLTPGVPEKRKHAALVVLANGDGKRVQNPKVAEQTNVVKAADARRFATSRSVPATILGTTVNRASASPPST